MRSWYRNSEFERARRITQKTDVVKRRLGVIDRAKAERYQRQRLGILAKINRHFDWTDRSDLHRNCFRAAIRGAVALRLPDRSERICHPRWIDSGSGTQRLDPERNQFALIAQRPLQKFLKTVADSPGIVRLSIDGSGVPPASLICFSITR